MIFNQIDEFRHSKVSEIKVFSQERKNEIVMLKMVFILSIYQKFQIMLHILFMNYMTISYHYEIFN